MGKLPVSPASPPKKFECRIRGQLLGTGNGGYVCRGIFHDHVVAYKVIKDRTPEQVEQIEAEFAMMKAFAAGRFANPHITRYLKLMQSPDRAGDVIIVMSLENGRDLENVESGVRKNFFEPLFTTHQQAQKNLGDFLLQTSTALQSLHKAGIAYRDMKPDNTLLRLRLGGEKNNPEDYLPINIAYLDFGGACENKASGMACQSIKRVFTRGYQAPEITGDTKQYLDFDGFVRADIFTLGRLWVSSLPGPGKTPLTTAIVDLTEKMLAVDPKTRPSLSNVIKTVRAQFPGANE
jgi:serine/threonine protein kinase